MGWLINGPAPAPQFSIPEKVVIAQIHIGATQVFQTILGATGPTSAAVSAQQPSAASGLADHQVAGDVADAGNNEARGNAATMSAQDQLTPGPAITNAIDQGSNKTNAAPGRHDWGGQNTDPTLPSRVALGPFQTVDYSSKQFFSGLSLSPVIDGHFLPWALLVDTIGRAIRGAPPPAPLAAVTIPATTIAAIDTLGARLDALEAAAVPTAGPAGPQGDPGPQGPPGPPQPPPQIVILL